MRFTVLGLCIWVSVLVEALPNALRGLTDQRNDTGTFQNPGVARKPRYRYWLPDASVDPELLADDIVQLAARGAGGIEFLNYFNYGGSSPVGVDWNIYGYATPAYRTILKAALQVHKDHGLLMDFSMGPQSGQGVPAEPDNPGLSWELVSFNETLTQNETYTGHVPGWGEGDLISAVTFAVLNTTNVTVSGVSLPGLDSSYIVSENLLSSESLTEVTDSIGSDGSITVNVSPMKGATSYLLYASYARRSYARACNASSDNPQNILQNGSFAVDHFSPTGAGVTTSFLEEYILIDGIKELMQETGHYIWEDSVEIPTYVYWTPGLPEAFEERHGYSMTPYLMLLSGNEGDQATSGGPVSFVSDTEDGGSGFVADFRSTMTDLLIEYLEYLNEWTHETLGLEFSQQVGYNLPVDMLKAIPSVDTPETETLSFTNKIDGFRQFCGPANLAGKNVISIELGADFGQAYYQSWTELLEEAKHAFVAGVNQVVIHGATYSHTYSNTTWPGFTSFEYIFASQHSRHQPAWDVGYKQAADYLARCQFVLQEGTAKVDLVFWDKQTAQNAYPNILYEPTDLEDIGYTYEYLSPGNFDLPAAYVQDGIFAPTQQEYKAMILRGNDTLTVAGVDALVKYANSGLPIILSGGLPLMWATNDQNAISQAENALESILKLDNVHQASYEGLANVVKEIGITPRSTIDCNGTWYTRWKETTDGDVYIYVYNDGDFSTGTISFQTTGSPFSLDAWTGEETSIAEYLVSGGRTVISFSLQSTETHIVRFSQSKNATDTESHIISSPDSVLGYQVDSSKVWAKVVASDSATSIKLSSGKTVTLYPQPRSLFSLGNWSVVIEQWLPPDDLYDVETVANKKNISLSISGSTLSSWTNLGYQNTSGIAYYASSFSWSKEESGTTGAYLVIPPVAHGLVISINGEEIPAVDITNPTVDVTTYLIQGDNTVMIKAASTLCNCLIPIWDQLLTGGVGPTFPYSEIEELLDYGPQEYGIVGDVQVVPYELVRII